MNIDLNNKELKFLVCGIGTTGIAVINFFQKRSLQNFYIYDDNKQKIIDYKVEDNKKIFNLEEIVTLNLDFIVISPGMLNVTKEHKIFQIARHNNIKIITDFDIFFSQLYQLNDNKKITIGITGTNGKSTVTSILTEALNKLGHKAVACGNIGIAILDLNISEYDIFVIESSSYQLALSNVHFDYGVITNISHDHIKEHGSFEHYISSKEKILTGNKISFVSTDDENVRKIYDKNKLSKNIHPFSVTNNLSSGFCFKNNDLFYNNSLIIKDLYFEKLPGRHNLQNILAILSILNLFSNDIFKNVETIKQCNPLKHRIQFIRKIGNISFYNDSKGTNANASQYAIQSFQKVFLIAGGIRKEDGFLAIRDCLQTIFKVFLIGQASDSFADELDILKIPYEKCDNLKVALQNAFSQALKELNEPISILLSPLCASQDQYKNYEERGDEFIYIVNKLV